MLAMKQIRERLGLTQTAVARELGVSRQAYNQWELGKRQADYEYLLRLGELFNTTVENILTGCLENAPPLTEQQEHLAELAEAGDPSPQVRMLMGLPERAIPDDMENAPAVIQNGSDLAKRLEALSDEELRKFMKFVDLMTSEDQHDKDELEMFMEFIVYRKKQKTAPKGGQK